MLVSNHLSYLDVLVLGAAVPCVFVAKREVRAWPLFGWFARAAGTIFIDRGRRGDVSRALTQLTGALGEDVLVVLFAEGTSSGGATVLPFKSSLLAAVVHAPASITAGCLAYNLDDEGEVPNEVCYWREMTLLPHLINLLGKRRIQARVAFAPHRPDAANVSDRKQLAQELHAQVLQLQEAIRFSCKEPPLETTEP